MQLIHTLRGGIGDLAQSRVDGTACDPELTEERSFEETADHPPSLSEGDGPGTETCDAGVCVPKDSFSGNSAAEGTTDGSTAPGE